MPTVRVKPQLTPPRRPAKPPAAKTPAKPVPAPVTGDVFEPPREFPTSPDGTRIYSQADLAWKKQILGKDLSIGRAGCAMVSTAMAIGKISGKPITPSELDDWLDQHKGYAGDSLDWSKAAAARDLKCQNERFKLATIDANLEAGKPCVIGVDYKQGGAGGPNGTDHWICLVAKETDAKGKVSYLANDPGTGRTVRLTPNAKGRLVSDGEAALGKYVTTNMLMTFS